MIFCMMHLLSPWLSPRTFSRMAIRGLLATTYSRECKITAPRWSARAFFRPAALKAGHGAPETNTSTASIDSTSRALMSPMTRGLCPNLWCIAVVRMTLSGQISLQKTGLTSHPKSFMARKSDPRPEQSDPSLICFRSGAGGSTCFFASSSKCPKSFSASFKHFFSADVVGSWIGGSTKF